jgi:hypothetical protein
MPEPLPLVWTLAEARTMLRISQAQLYNLINRGEIGVVHQGRRAYITDPELKRYVAKLVEKEAS